MNEQLTIEQMQEMGEDALLELMGVDKASHERAKKLQERVAGLFPSFVAYVLEPAEDAFEQVIMVSMIAGAADAVMDMRMEDAPSHIEEVADTMRNIARQELLGHTANVELLAEAAINREIERDRESGE